MRKFLIGTRKTMRIAGAAAALALAGGAAAELPQAPEPGRVYRVGFITYARLGQEAAIKQALAGLGYVEGKNIVYEGRAGNRNLAAMDKEAEALVAWKPDVIVSMMTNAHVAVQKATRANPIPVVLWSTDPVETGVVKSFRKPGTNFTGFSYDPITPMAYLRVLRLAIPNIRCVGHLYNHTYAPAPSSRRQLEEAGVAMKLPIRIYEVLEKDKLEPALAQMRKDGCDGFVVGPHEFFNGNGEMIGQLALKYKLAAVSLQTSITRGGGLAAYSPPFPDGWPAMAPVIVRLMHGAKPADIPIDRSHKSPLTLNLAAARKLGLTVPASLVDEADELIE